MTNKQYMFRLIESGEFESLAKFLNKTSYTNGHVCHFKENADIEKCEAMSADCRECVKLWLNKSVDGAIPDLHTGMFVKVIDKFDAEATKELIGVVVDDKIVYDDGCYDIIKYLLDESNDLYYISEVYAAGAAQCFNDIKNKINGMAAPIWEKN